VVLDLGKKSDQKLYCNKYYEQVVKKEDCWNLFEGSQIKETEKTEKIDVVEIDDKKDVKKKSR
jgi:hypothetical protein